MKTRFNEYGGREIWAGDMDFLPVVGDRVSLQNGTYFRVKERVIALDHDGKGTCEVHFFVEFEK